MEHISGHHKHLATPDDPATPAMGSSLYTFWVKSAVWGFYKTAERETARVDRIADRRGAGFVGRMNLQLERNKVLSIGLIQAAYALGLYLTFGKKAFLVSILAWTVAIFFVEWINYIEHYGLQRKKDPRGVYESITLDHSWNSYSTTLLFRI